MNSTKENIPQFAVLAPSPGESVNEVQIAKWLAQENDFVKKNQPLLEIESEKASLQIVAEKSGLLNILKDEGEVVAPGDKIAIILEGEQPEEPLLKKPVLEDKPSSNNKEPAVAAETESVTPSKPPSVAAEKMIAENKLDAASISASGKDGRITKADVLKVIADQPELKKEAAPSQPVTDLPNALDESFDSQERLESRKKMSQLRKKISARLVAVKNETAMLTTFNEVNLAAIIKVRKKYKELFKEKHNVGLGFMSFFAKACTTALMEFSMINSRIEDAEIITSHYVDLGIAVSAPKGLMVPIIRNAEKLSLAQIESQILILAEKARSGSIAMSEMTGGSFTITNGGVFGSMLSTPILNPPQSAILGMHNIVERPVAINGEVVIQPIMYLALSYDHRVVDGKDSVSFLVRVKSLLEDPIRLLLDA